MGPAGGREQPRRYPERKRKGKGSHGQGKKGSRGRQVSHGKQTARREVPPREVTKVAPAPRTRHQVANATKQKTAREISKKDEDDDDNDNVNHYAGVDDDDDAEDETETDAVDYQNNNKDAEKKDEGQEEDDDDDKKKDDDDDDDSDETTQKMGEGEEGEEDEGKNEQKEGEKLASRNLPRTRKWTDPGATKYAFGCSAHNCQKLYWIENLEKNFPNHKSWLVFSPPGEVAKCQNVRAVNYMDTWVNLNATNVTQDRAVNLKKWKKQLRTNAKYKSMRDHLTQVHPNIARPDMFKQTRKSRSKGVKCACPACPGNHQTREEAKSLWEEWME